MTEGACVHITYAKIICKRPQRTTIVSLTQSYPMCAERTLPQSRYARQPPPGGGFSIPPSGREVARVKRVTEGACAHTPHTTIISQATAKDDVHIPHATPPFVHRTRPPHCSLLPPFAPRRISSRSDFIHRRWISPDPVGFHSLTSLREVAKRHEGLSKQHSALFAPECDRATARKVATEG